MKWWNNEILFYMRCRCMCFVGYFYLNHSYLPTASRAAIAVVEIQLICFYSTDMHSNSRPVYLCSNRQRSACNQPAMHEFDFCFLQRQPLYFFTHTQFMNDAHSHARELTHRRIKLQKKKKMSKWNDHTKWRDRRTEKQRIYDVNERKSCMFGSGLKEHARRGRRQKFAHDSKAFALSYCECNVANLHLSETCIRWPALANIRRSTTDWSRQSTFVWAATQIHWYYYLYLLCWQRSVQR